MLEAKPAIVYNADLRIPALDGVRGIAILLVMAHHFTIYGMTVPTTTLDWRFYRVFAAGWCGVDLFFVLSGFLITGILLDAKGRANFFRNFYMRRILRIFPLYYGFLIIFFFLLPLVWSMGEKFQSLLDQQGWYWSYLVNLPIAIEGWPPYYSLGHFWSLAVEEQFYLFWPLVVFFCGQRQLMVICAVCFLGSFGVRLGFAIAGNPLAGLVLTPARMDTLAVGAFLALVVRRPGGLKNLTRWMWPIGSMAAIILGAIFVWQRGLRELDIIVQTVGYSLIAVMFGALLVAASTSSTERRMGKVFSHPTLLFFGRYSYGLYVFHHPVVLAMRSTMLGDSGLPIYFGSQLPSLALYFAAATGISVSLALLSWHGFELQFLKLKALFPRSTSAAPTPRKRYEISPFSQP